MRPRSRTAPRTRMIEALVPWTELAGRTPTDAAVLEAKLAVPYAHRRTRRARAGARPVPGRDRAPSSARRPGLDESIAADPRRPAARRPDRQQPGRRDGLVLEHRRTAAASATAPRRAPRSGAGDARIPGGVQELPRPAVPGAQPAAVAGQASTCCATCWPTAARPSPSACRRCARRSARPTWPRPNSATPRWRPSSSASSARSTRRRSPPPPSASCRRGSARVRDTLERSGARSRSWRRPRERLPPRRRRAAVAAERAVRRAAVEREEGHAGTRAQARPARTRTAAIAAAQRDEPAPDRPVRGAHRGTGRARARDGAARRDAGAGAAGRGAGTRGGRAGAAEGARWRPTARRRASPLAQIYDRATVGKEGDRAPAQ